MTLEINFSHPTLDKIKSSPLFETTFLKQKLASFKQTINDANYGFFNVTEREELQTTSLNIYEEYQNKKTFVQVGIGGSSLGPEMLITSLGKTDRKFVFINNIDPEQIADQLSTINFNETLFYIVSKSGGTAETMAAFSIITSLLENAGIDKDQYKDYFVFATDPTTSQLLEIGRELKISCLEIPSNVGGRFTVLTPAGFLPALFAGIDVKELIKGANAIKASLTTEDLVQNQLLQTASFLCTLKEQEQISQTVFMPYSSKLRDLSFWFVQLWAESLGKKYDLDKQEVCAGFTPIPAYGATDQHSQVQLFMEGPKDKCLVMIDVKNYKTNFSLKNTFNYPSLKKLSPYSLSDLLKAEFYGTLKALESNHRPYIHFSIDQNDAFNMGQLIMFFECLTVMVGDYLNINPFDQPGVEAGKIFAFELLDAQ